jgi:hypothetical protein
MLGGTLKIESKGPQKKRFTILSADAVTGTFSNPDGIVKDGDRRFRIVYKAESVELEQIPGS